MKLLRNKTQYKRLLEKKLILSDKIINLNMNIKSQFNDKVKNSNQIHNETISKLKKIKTSKFDFLIKNHFQNKTNNDVYNKLDGLYNKVEKENISEISADNEVNKTNTNGNNIIDTGSENNIFLENDSINDLELSSIKDEKSKLNNKVPVQGKRKIETFDEKNKKGNTTDSKTVISSSYILDSPLTDSNNQTSENHRNLRLNKFIDKLIKVENYEYLNTKVTPSNCIFQGGLKIKLNNSHIQNNYNNDYYEFNKEFDDMIKGMKNSKVYKSNIIGDNSTLKSKINNNDKKDSILNNSSQIFSDSTFLDFESYFDSNYEQSNKSNKLKQNDDSKSQSLKGAKLKIVGTNNKITNKIDKTTNKTQIKSSKTSNNNSDNTRNIGNSQINTNPTEINSSSMNFKITNLNKQPVFKINNERYGNVKNMFEFLLKANSNKIYNKIGNKKLTLNENELMKNFIVKYIGEKIVVKLFNNQIFQIKRKNIDKICELLKMNSNGNGMTKNENSNIQNITFLLNHRITKNVEMGCISIQLFKNNKSVDLLNFSYNLPCDSIKVKLPLLNYFFTFLFMELIKQNTNFNHNFRIFNAKSFNLNSQITKKSTISFNIIMNEVLKKYLSFYNKGLIKTESEFEVNKENTNKTKLKLPITNSKLEDKKKNLVFKVPNLTIVDNYNTINSQFNLLFKSSLTNDINEACFYSKN